MSASSTDFDNYISDDGRNFQAAKATFAYSDEQGPASQLQYVTLTFKR